MRSIRTQLDCMDDQMNQLYSPSVACTADEDKTRQEFKNECDLNWLLRKYGALPPVSSFPVGEVDFDLDLLSAKTALSEARKAYEAFPRVLREQLSFQGFLEAVANGSFAASPLSKGGAKKPDSPAPESA